jgi:hypothetical protein
MLFEISDHGVKTIKQGFHFIPPLIGNCDFEVTEPDLFGASQKLPDGGDDHPSYSSGKKKYGRYEKDRNENQEFDQFHRGFGDLLLLEGKWKRDEKKIVLDKIRNSQNLERVIADFLSLSEIGKIVIQYSVVDFPIDLFGKKTVIKKLSPA